MPHSHIAIYPYSRSKWRRVLISSGCCVWLGLNFV